MINDDDYLRRVESLVPLFVYPSLTASESFEIDGIFCTTAVANGATNTVVPGKLT